MENSETPKTVNQPPPLDIMLALLDIVFLAQEEGRVIPS